MIPLVRVDNRLLHGQVLETSILRLGAAAVVVADDEAARSPLAQAAMTLCCPAVPVRVQRLDEVDFAALAAEPRPVLVLVRDVAGLTAAVARGLTPARAPRLNLGNVHLAPGRRPVAPRCSSPGSSAGATPSGALAAGASRWRRGPSPPTPAGLDELRRRYASAR